MRLSVVVVALGTFPNECCLFITIEQPISCDGLHMETMFLAHIVLQSARLMRTVDLTLLQHSVSHAVRKKTLIYNPYTDPKHHLFSNDATCTTSTSNSKATQKKEIKCQTSSGSIDLSSNIVVHSCFDVEEHLVAGQRSLRIKLKLM